MTRWDRSTLAPDEVAYFVHAQRGADHSNDHGLVQGDGANPGVISSAVQADGKTLIASSKAAVR